MLYAPDMLLIGSAGRNSGKTTFACALIGRLHHEHEIVAAKVTTVQERGGTCPRGGEGCGVCAAIEGRYCITEETVSSGTKDTQRLLGAGAYKVYWLRVLKEYLDEGAAALLDIVGKGRLVVCESNSLRMAVEPGVFLLFQHSGMGSAKASASAVREHVDRYIVWDGAQFDFDADDIAIEGNFWAFRYAAAAVILAGGKSKRMGQDKTIMEIGGRPLIQHVYDQLRPHFSEVFISANDAAKFGFLEARVIQDIVPDQGPLAGIVSALRASPRDLNLVVACDVGKIDLRLVRRLMRTAERSRADAVVPRHGASHTEPLFAVYRKSALASLERALADGVRSVREVLKRCDVHYLDLADADLPLNLNAAEDYVRFASRPASGGVQST